MRNLKALFDFYLDASIHVGLAVASLVLVTSILLNIPLENALLGFAFFSTIVCYNFIKYGVEAEKYLIVSRAYHKRIQVFSFLSFVFALWSAIELSQSVLLAVMILGLLCVLYAIPFFPKTRNLRNLARLKIYIVGLVWSGFTVLLPVLQAEIPVDWDVIVLLIQRFLLVFVLMLPFEIRDMESDFKALKTIPQILGVQSTLVLGVLVTLSFVLLTFFKDAITSEEILTRIFVGLTLIGGLVLSKKKQPKYFTSFWIEAIPIIWVGLLLVLR